MVFSYFLCRSRVSHSGLCPGCGVGAGVCEWAAVQTTMRIRNVKGKTDRFIAILPISFRFRRSESVTGSVPSGQEPCATDRHSLVPSPHSHPLQPRPAKGPAVTDVDGG